VNNLASKLRLSLFPPGQPFFRFSLPDAVAAAIAGEDPKALTKVENGLIQLENDALDILETENHGVMLHAALKQLIVAGNVLLYMPTEGGSRVFRLQNYVVMRDAMGHWFEIVARETVHRLTLDEVTKEAVQLGETKKSDDETVEVFTHIRREDGKAVWNQEINEIVVPGSEGRSDLDDCPYIPLRWSALENEDYGRGHVEEHLGDLRSLEGLSGALVKFAVAASKVIFLDRPNSTTDIEAIQSAESGDFVEGNEEDIGVLQVGKFPDFQVAKSQVDDLTLRISHAFLLQSGTIRNAERVTKAEIQGIAQELEDVLGGVYTVLAAEMQQKVVRRLVVSLKSRGQFPRLPKGAFKMSIVTGFEALGRGHELNKLRAFFQDGIGTFGEGFMELFAPQAVAEVLANHHNVDIESIKKSPEQAGSEQQQQMANQVVQQAAGPVAGAVAKEVAPGIAENITAQSQQ
jgi:hypothetical protein